MFKVNNKKTIGKLSKSSYKANKMRNIFAAIAIVLTTVLFTGLFTVITSMVASFEESTMRQVGGSSHGGFKYVTMEQYEKIKLHPSIKNISYSRVLGIAENQKLSKRPSEIRFANDELCAKNMFALPTMGKLPEKNDEIATDTIVLESLGIPAELGQKVTLEYSIGDEKYSETFTLVGFWQGDILMQASQVWMSRSYVEDKLAGYTPKNKNDLVGAINTDINFSNAIDIEGKLEKVLVDSGFAQGEIAYGVNWAYTGNNGSLEPMTILGGIAVILMIVFCGYLIISNVFFISVAKDTRFYGLIKTIGTTGKQIRILIRRQAMGLCAIGIPIGLLLGSAVGAILTPVMLNILNTNVIKISINPLVFIASASFAIFTVFISIARPSKIAARVSPMEALRSTDGIQKNKKSTKKNNNVNLWNIANGNVFRNKKKAVLVTISLSLSLIILNVAFSMSNSFDVEKYVSGRIGSDFAVGDVSNFNVHIYYANQETLSHKFLTELSEKDGIESIDNIYFCEPEADFDPRLASLPERAEKEMNLMDAAWLSDMKKAAASPKMLQHIYGIDKNIVKRLTVFSGTIDYEKLQTGKYVVVSAYDSGGKLNYYNVGDKVTVTNVDGINKEYEVLAVASLPYNISAQHSHPIAPHFLFSSDVFLRDIADKVPMLTTLEVADDKEKEMEEYLTSYCETIDYNMDYQSKATFVTEYEGIQSTYKSVGLILSLLVAFIGIMNFINTIVTSIIARKRELAMLQSIGMTGKQTQKMLVYEGVIYTALTAIFTLTIGSALGCIGLYALSGNGPYFTLQFTSIPAIMCFPVLGVVSAVVPYITGRMMIKNSLVERLREAE